jgi:hypothetical protein
VQHVWWRRNAIAECLIQDAKVEGGCRDAVHLLCCVGWYSSGYGEVVKEEMGWFLVDVMQKKENQSHRARYGTKIVRIRKRFTKL